jgi:hypothetical protein
MSTEQGWISVDTDGTPPNMVSLHMLVYDTSRGSKENYKHNDNDVHNQDLGWKYLEVQGTSLGVQHTATPVEAPLRCWNLQRTAVSQRASPLLLLPLFCHGQDAHSRNPLQSIPTRGLLPRALAQSACGSPDT